MTPLFGFGEGLFAPQHLLLFLIIGILLFGRRLPEVGRSLGKGIVEFKKGLKGLEDEVDTHTSLNTQQPQALEPPRPPQRVATNVPKFEDTAPPTPPAPPA